MKDYLKEQLTTFGGRLRWAIQVRKSEDPEYTQEKMIEIMRERYGVSIGQSYFSKLVSLRNAKKDQWPGADKVRAFCMALDIDARWLLMIPGYEEMDARVGDEIDTVAIRVRSTRTRELLREIVTLGADMDEGDLRMIIEYMKRLRRGVGSTVRFVESIEENEKVKE